MTARPTERTQWSAIYSMVSGPILWFIHFLAVYAIGEFGCRANFTNLAVISPDVMRLLIMIATVICGIGMVLGAWLAYGAWQTLPADETHDNDVQMRTRFMALSSLMLNALFLFAIVLIAAPTFVLPVCDRATG